MYRVMAGENVVSERIFFEKADNENTFDMREFWIHTAWTFSLNSKSVKGFLLQ